MTKVITFALQKGGVGKTTSSALTAHLLAEAGYNVLTIDLDSQGNLTQIISGYDDLTVFADTTLKEALEAGDLSDFIREARPGLDYVPTDDFLALIDRYDGPNDRNSLLKIALEPVKADYDYIIVDTPPSLSLQTLNALMASDYVVVMFETAKMAYNAIERFKATVEGVQAAGNNELEIIGILATLNDARRSDSKQYLARVREEYDDLLFDTIIKRKASVGRIPSLYLTNNPEIKDATAQHAEFVKELIERVEAKTRVR